MIIRFIRVIFLIFIFLIILALGLLYYIKENVLVKEIFKYNIIRILKPTHLNLNFSNIHIIQPDLVLVENLRLTNKNFVVYIKKLKLNIDIISLMTKYISSDTISLKDVDVIDGISVESGNINIFSQRYTAIEPREYLIYLRTIKKISILNTIVKSPNYNINIHQFNSSRNFFSNTVDTEFNIALSNINLNLKLNGQAFIRLEESINIESLDLSFNEKNFYIKGDLVFEEGKKSNISLTVPFRFDIKEIINIPKSIIIEPFNAEITAYLDKEKLNIFSRIDRENADVNIIYNIKTNKLLLIDIKTSKTDLGKVKNYLLDYIKNFNGNADIHINIKPSEKKHLIEVYSKNLTCTDIFDIANFKNIEVKFLVTEKFHALNVINIFGNFPYGRLSGSLKLDTDNISEKIETKLNLDNNIINSNIIISNIPQPDKRAYKIKINTTNFSFRKFLEISNYVEEKIKKHQTENNTDSRYNIINKKLSLYLKSDNYADEPYITSEKLFMKAEYTRTNTIMNSQGKFMIKLINGKIKDIQQNKERNKTYELVTLPLTQIYTLNRTGALRLNFKLTDINFQDTGIIFTINNGKIIIDKFYLNSKEFLAYSNGEVDLNSRKINMNVYVINSKNYKSGALPENLTDEKGRPSLAFSISGTFDKNDIKLLDATEITRIVEDEVKSSVLIEE